eukprot:COSAG06_NODE_5268_length_3597_cov_2.646083_4_plen_131_part_00
MHACLSVVAHVDMGAAVHQVMTETDQECVLCILLLSFVCTGSIGRKQKKLFDECCKVIKDSEEGKQRVRYYQSRLDFLSIRFRNFQLITAQDLRRAFDPSKEAAKEVKASRPRGAACTQFAFALSKALTF